MSTTATLDNKIDNLVQSQVANGVSTHDARQKIMQKLFQQEIDEGIARGRADIKAGRYTVVNKETTKEFIDKLAKRLLSNH